MNDMSNISRPVGAGDEWTALDFLKVLPEGLSAEARLTYLVLWYDAGRMRGPSFATCEQIQRHTMLSENDHTRALHDLVQDGFITESSMTNIGRCTILMRIVNSPLPSVPDDLRP